MRKNSVFLAVLLLATIFTQNAWAEVQFGMVDFDETWGNGRIDFAVYDFSSQSDYLNFTNNNLELEDPFDSIAVGEYIYVYQIVNNDPLDDKAIFSFEVFADGDNTIDDEASIDSFSDSPDEFSDAGVEPSDQYYDDIEQAKIVWEFEEFGYIEKDENSWFLMLKSDFAPVTGDFEIKGPQINPEPATMALFGLGSLILFRKRKIRVT